MPSIFDRMNSDLEKLNKQSELDAAASMAQAQQQTTPAQTDPLMGDPNQPQEPEQPQTPEQQNMEAQLTRDNYADNLAPGSANWAENIVEGDPATWDPYYTQMSFAQKAGRSLLRGFGDQVIGGAGDILQMGNLLVDRDVTEGNMASRWLQEIGKDIADDNQNYTTIAFREQMEKNAWNIKTAMHPDFWSNSVAEGIPMLVEMVLLSKGFSGLARKGASTALKSLGKAGAEDVAGSVLHGLGKTTVGATELNALGASALDMVSGGFSMNLLAGLMNAAELVNTYKEYKNDDGTPVYDEKQLAEMASASVTNNFQYLPIDMLSWGITYGLSGKNASQVVQNMMKKGAGKGTKMFTQAQSLKNTSNMFAASTKGFTNVIKKVVMPFSKAVGEGVEETFQETFEEWAKIRAKAKVDGKEPPEYFDFYFSKENEATRAVSMALGMLGGGAAHLGSLKSSMNKQAEESYKFYDKNELLKNVIKNSDRKLHNAQIQAANEMLINNKYHGDVNNMEFIQGLAKKGIIDENETEALMANAQLLEETWENASKMNVKGKVTYASSVMQKAHFLGYMDQIKETHKKNVAEIKASDATEETKAKRIAIEDQVLEEQTAIGQDSLGRIAAFQEGLLAGNQKIKPEYSKFVADENGNETLVRGLSPEQYHQFYEMKDEAVLAEVRKSKERKGWASDLSGKAKEAYNNIFKKSEADEQAQEVSPENNDQEVKGSETEEGAGITTDNAEGGELKNGEQPISNTNPNPIKNETTENKGGENQVVNPNQGENVSAESKKNPAPDQQKSPNKAGVEGSAESTWEAVENLDKALAVIRRSFPDKKLDDDVKTLEYGISQLQNMEDSDEILASYKKALADLKTMQGSEEKIGNINKGIYKVKKNAAIGQDASTQLDEKGMDELNMIIDTEKRKGTEPQRIMTILESLGYKADDMKLLSDLVALEKKTSAKGRKSVSSMAYALHHKSLNSPEQYEKWMNSTAAEIRHGMSTMSEAIALNAYLKKAFPGQNISAYAINNLTEAVGAPAVGYALGSVIYLDERTWDQDELFLHEFTHILYPTMKDTEGVKRIIEQAKQNKDFLAQIMDYYEDDVVMVATKDIHVGADNRLVKKGEFFDQGELADMEDGKIPIDHEIAPWYKQDLINEELFANFLQGPLSKEFNRYFDSVKEPKRQSEAKRFWAQTKKAVDPRDADYIFEKISPDQQTQMDYQTLVKSYKEAVKGPVGSTGRKAAIMKNHDATGKRIGKVMDRWREAVAAHDPRIANGEKDAQGQLLNTMNNLNEEARQLWEESVLFSIPEEVSDGMGIDYDKTYQRIQAKAGTMIKSFVDTYKSSLRSIMDQEAAENNTVAEHSNTEHRLFKSKLMQSAKEIKNPFEWIDAITNPHESEKELIEFNDFLNNNRGENKLLVLRSMHMIFTNTVTYPTVIGNIDASGNVSFDQSTSFSENMQAGSIVRNVQQYIADRDAVVVDIIDKITRGDMVTPEEYSKLLIKISPDSVYATAIAEKGLINMGHGKTDLKHFFDKYFALGQEISDRDMFEMADNIVATSRAFTSDSVVQGAEMDQNDMYNYTASKHLTNALSNQFEEIEDALRSGMTKQEFKDHFRNIKTNQKINGFSIPGANNRFMDFIYDNYERDGMLPSLSMYIGDRNQRTKKNVSYRDTDGTTLYLSDVLRFLKGDTGYLSSLNTFGDSKRSIMTNLQKYNLEKADINNRETIKALRDAYHIYKLSQSKWSAEELQEVGSTDYQTFEEYKKATEAAIADSIKYFEDNWSSLRNYDDFLYLYNKNGKLTESGKAEIASHELSSILNKTFIHELTTPSVPIEDNIKRNKMNISPAMVISPKMRIENVILAREWFEKRDENNQIEYDRNGKKIEYETNDSGQYITEETAKKLEQAGMGVIDLNKGFKMVNYKVEKGNPKFNGRALALKGYVTILSEDQVKEFPKLKVIRDLLLEREAKFVESYKNKGKLSDIYNDPTSDMDYIAIASPVSAEKGHLLSKKQMELLNGEGGLATMDSLKTEAGKKAYLEVMDNIHYSGEDFIGFDGSNLGPQMRMDMQRNQSKIPVQLRSGILVAANYLGIMSTAEKILNNYNAAVTKQAKEKILNHVLDDNGNLIKDSDIAKFVLANSDMENIAPIEEYLLSLDNPSLGNPRLSVTAKNQIKNLLMRYSNNLIGAGTIAQQKSELAGHVIPGVTIKDSYTQDGMAVPLNFYKRKANGDFNAMEGILPKYMEKQVRKREYFVLTDEQGKGRIKELISKNNAIKDEYNLRDKDDVQYNKNIEDFMEQHFTLIGDQKHYYLPGEKVLVTRVPSSGPSFTGVMEVVAFDQTGASNIMVPSEFKNVIGSDDDGDQLFINRVDKDNKDAKEYNEFLTSMMDHWLSAKMNPTLSTPLDPSSKVDEVIERIGGKKTNKVMPFSSRWARSNHNDALGASQTIGIAFNDHRLYNGLAAYGTDLRNPKTGGQMLISLGGSEYKGSFEDTGVGNQSRIHKSNTITQIVLDSAKNGQAEALGLNKQTIGYAMALTNMGFDLETVGRFLNQPLVKQYTERVASRGNLYEETESEYSVLEDLAKNELKFKDSWQRSDVNAISFDFNDTSLNNQYEALRLIKYLNNLKEDMQKINTVMKGHKDISSDPFVIEKQMKDFNNLTSNQGQTSMTFKEEYKNNPEAKMYLKTLENAHKILGGLSIEYSTANKPIYQKIIEAVHHGLGSDYNAKKISDYLKVYSEGKFLGFNNKYDRIEMERVIAAQVGGEFIEGSLLEEFAEHKAYLETQNVWEDPTNPFNRISDYDRNLFLTRVLKLSQADGNVFIGTHALARSTSLTTEEIEAYAADFQKLPASLQEKFLLTDLILNEWKGNNSILSFTGSEILNTLNQSASRMMSANDSSSPETIKEVSDIIINNIMTTSPKSFKPIKKTYSPGEKVHDIEDKALHTMLLKGKHNDAELMQTLLNTKGSVTTPEIYYRIERQDAKGRSIDGVQAFLKITGSTYNEFAQYVKDNRIVNEKTMDSYINHNKKGSPYQLSELYLSYLLQSGKVSVKYADPKASYNIDLLAVKDNNISPNLKYKSEGQVKKKAKSKLGRAAKADFQNYMGKTPLTLSEFKDALQLKYPVSPAKLDIMHQKYLRDKDDANAISDKFTKELVAKKTDQELLDDYKTYGYKDIYAYSNVMVPIILEINQRSMNEQSKLTGRQEDGSDIGLFKSWLQTNNIDSNHPATQAVQRHLETQYKAFINEKKKYTKRISEASDALYNEKFNDKFSPIPYFNKVRRAFTVLVTDRNTLYEKLYGGIITTDEDETTTGKVMKRIKLLPEKELTKKLANGQISEAEFNFAKVFRETIGELAPFSGKKDFDTNGYVPAVAMSRMEKFSHRGLLGLFANSRTENEAIYDVMMNFNGKTMSFKAIEDHFRSTAENNISNIAQLAKIKLKAISLVKKRQNEDGSALMVSTVSNKTMLGDGMMERFAKNDFLGEEEFMSMDLDKALHDFVHASLFVNGNNNFKGFVQLQSMVDGLLIHNDQKGFKNQNKFVLSVYKQGFLNQANRREEGPVDKVVDALTRANLLYILGYKALVLQKGIYAIGNIVVGKYHNIKNNGGKAWINGEKRYWGQTRGELGVKKSAGVLKTLNVSDYNVYDNVAMEREYGIGSVFTDIALSPMIHSENWIQKVHFLGLLSDEQWNRFDNDGNYKPGAQRLTNDEINILEGQVKSAHGKGYQATDQRMIQQYSWGRMMMQFARFIPTMVYDRFGKSDIDIYGREHVGSLRLVGNVVYSMASGEMSPKEYVTYRKGLSPEKRRILDSGLRGLAITASAAFLGQTFNIDTLNEMTGDANYLVNTDKLEWKIMPSTIRTMHDIML